MKNLHVNILAFVLILVSGILCYYKVSVLKLPLLPSEQTQVWTVEAKITYKPTKGPAKIDFALPKKPRGFMILDEDFVSGRYGLTLTEDGDKRSVQWALRRPHGAQVLYYRLQLSPYDQPPTPLEKVPFPPKKQYPEMMQTVINALLDEVRSKSADIESFTHELLLRLNNPRSDDDIKLLHEGIEKPELWVERVISILQGARIPARQVDILILKDGVRHGTLTPWLQVHDGHDWLAFNPNTGDAGFPEDAVIWKVGGQPLLDVSGGKSAKVEFSVYKQFQDVAFVAQQRANKINSRIMEFSLFNLPVQTQNVYRVLLMIPLGALLIVILRNVVGIKSIGTFMPVLIALAFRETELGWGLVLFSLIIVLGLMLRFYLEYLQLLLVPRLAAVLIIVILLMLLVSLLSHKLGIHRGLSVALFPMVIMAMTIERMSLVWEERGPSEAIQQGIGTLFIASAGYLLMTNVYLEHLIFIFPELLLMLLAFTLLLGRYTGYRLTELWRFRGMLQE